MKISKSNKSQKVLLVNPLYSSVYTSVKAAKGCSNPINLAYLASYIRSKGIDVEIFDANALQIPRKHLFDKMPRDFSVIGVSSYTPSIHLSIDVLKIAKEIDSSCMTIIGGSHFSGDPINTMKNNAVIDFGIKKEGEITLYELLSEIWSKQRYDEIPGLVYRTNDGKIVNNKDRQFINDLDELPMPAYDLLPMDKYYLPAHHVSLKNISTQPFSLLFTSRGCFESCTFCASKVVWDKRVRFHTPERIIMEIQHLKSKYNVQTIEFADDNFLLYKKRFNNILNALIKNNMNIHFNCLSRVDNISEEDMKVLKKAGCYLIRFGVESGSQKILDGLKKNITVDHIKKAFRTAKKVDIAANASIIIGTPGETKETVNETLDLLLEIDPDITYFFYSMPLVGTELRSEVIRHKQLIHDAWRDWDIMSKPMAVTESLSIDQLVQIRKLYYRKYYLRISFIFKKLIRIRNITILKYYFNGFLAVLTLVFKSNKNTDI